MANSHVSTSLSGLLGSRPHQLVSEPLDPAIESSRGRSSSHGGSGGGSPDGRRVAEERILLIESTLGALSVHQVQGWRTGSRGQLASCPWRRSLSLKLHQPLGTFTLWQASSPEAPPPPNPKKSSVSLATGDPLSLKQVEPNGDIWLPCTQHRMVTSSFQITLTKLKHLQSKISSHVIPAFETISGLIWKSIAKIRVGKEPNLVTIIRNDCSEERSQVLSNKQVISTVAATDSSSLAKLEVSELAMLIRETSKDEKEAIEEVVEKENGTGDFIVYGANLTFVDMGGADLYDFDLKGQKPVCVECNISGVGDEGAVLVLQEPEDDGGKLTVTLILPEHEMPELKQPLGREWGIVA